MMSFVVNAPLKQCCHGKAGSELLCDQCKQQGPASPTYLYTPGTSEPRDVDNVLPPGHDVHGFWHGHAEPEDGVLPPPPVVNWSQVAAEKNRRYQTAADQHAEEQGEVSDRDDVLPPFRQ